MSMEGGGSRIAEPCRMLSQDCMCERKGIAHSYRPWVAATSMRIQESCSEGSKWFFEALMPDVYEREGKRTRIKKAMEHPLSRMWSMCHADSDLSGLCFNPYFLFEKIQNTFPYAVVHS